MKSEDPLGLGDGFASLFFETLSGTVYEVKKIGDDFGFIRRDTKGKAETKRGDDRWVPFEALSPIIAGYPVQMTLFGLVEQGPDDYGNASPERVSTTRTTNCVTKVWREQ